MKISKYLKTAHQTDQLPAGSLADEINPYLGLAGEIGYLLTTLKKEVRENAPTADATKATVKDELGDIVWYVVTIAKRTEIDFQRDVLFGNLRRIQDNFTDSNLAPAPLFKRELEPGGDVSEAIKLGPTAIKLFSDYQTLAVKTSKFKDRDALVPYLVQVWGNVDTLLRPFGLRGKRRKRDDLPSGDKEATARALGDVMWYVAGFAAVYKLSLDEIMFANAAKIVSAFPTDAQKSRTPLYDAGLGPLREFPRKFNVDFVEEAEKISYMLINGVRVGDPLTDNSYEIDGYRYHDAIHLAFIAVLGWSPVMRDLMKRKRKGCGDLDEVEDGARARIVEEMIVKIAHSYAVGFGKSQLLDGKKHINLNLLKDIVRLAEGLEVSGARDGFEGCKYWEWQEAILRGFQIYNQLRNAKGGRITVDLKERKVTFKKLRKGQGTRMLIGNG